jgi:hypothetical protein
MSKNRHEIYCIQYKMGKLTIRYRRIRLENGKTTILGRTRILGGESKKILECRLRKNYNYKSGKNYRVL